MTKTSMDRPLMGTEETDSSNSDSTLRPKLDISAYVASLLTVDVGLEYRSTPIGGKYLKKLIRLTKRRLKSQTWKANKGPIIEALFQKIQIDHKNKR